MTLPTLNYYQGVKILLRQIDAPNTTKVIYFSERANTQATADATPYWPILISVSGFGGEMDEFLPRPYSGSFTIDNTIGTFGEGRKFSDLFERYTAINQPVEIHLDQLDFENDVFTFDSNSRAWIARVTAIETNPDPQQSTITFGLTQDPIPDSQICAMISEATVSANAPDKQAAGKWLPVAAGSYNYLPGYGYTSNTTSRTYAYATNYESKFIHQVTSIYSRDVDGTWCEITSGITSAYDRDGGTASYSLDPATNPEWVFAISNPSSYNGILTGVKFEMDPNGSGGRTSTCLVTVSVYERVTTAGNLTMKRLATGTANLATWDTENNTPTDFDMTIPFDRAVTLNYGRTGYAIGISCTGWAAGEASIYKCNTDNCSVWRRNLIGNYQLTSGSADAPAMTCYFTTVADSSTVAIDSDGKQLAGVTLSAASSTYTPEDKWANTDVIVKTTGLLDDTGGTITGGNRGQITRPDHFIKALAYTSADSGSTWSASTDWDWTTYASAYTANYTVSSGQNPRLLVGYQDAPVTSRQLIEAVCRDSASRIGINADGTLFLWPWGHSAEPSDTIPPEDIIPISWSIGDPSSVVNRVKVTYGVTNIEIVSFRNKKQRNNYTGTYDRSIPFRGVAQRLSANSVLAWGRRELAVSETDYIGDATSAQTMLDYYMIRYAHPLILSEIEVPYHKYNALKLLQIVTFSHPAFPKHAGARPRHEEPYEQETDVRRAFLKGGRHWHAVKPWRGQIEKWSVDKPKGEAPRMKLLLRVLPNYPIDPT